MPGRISTSFGLYVFNSPVNVPQELTTLLLMLLWWGKNRQPYCPFITNTGR